MKIMIDFQCKQRAVSAISYEVICGRALRELHKMNKISQNSKSVIGGLMEYLEEKGKQNLLPELTKGLESKLAREKQKDEIIVTSTVRLSSSQLNTLKSIMHKYLKVRFPVINKIDENLIGGFTVKANDMFLDLSLSRDMEILKRNLLI